MITLEKIIAIDQCGLSNLNYEEFQELIKAAKMWARVLENNSDKIMEFGIIAMVDQLSGDK